MTEQNVVLRMVTPEFRIMRAFVFKPETPDLYPVGSSQARYADNKYKVIAGFDKSDAESLKPMKLLAIQAIKKVWPNAGPAEINPVLNRIFTDGDISADNYDKKAKLKGKAPGRVDFYRGKYLYTFKSKDQPGVARIVGDRVEDVLDPTAIYAGAWAFAEVNAKFWPASGAEDSKDYVSFYLNKLCKSRDDQRLGGGGSRPASEVFAGVVGGQSAAKVLSDDFDL